MEKPDLYVVARFLDRLQQEPNPPLKTELQLKVRINYSIFQRYLAWLTQRGFVAIIQSGNRECVQLTPAGREAHAQLAGWIRSAVGAL